MKYTGTEELTQDIFNDQPDNVNWCGVDYNGTLNFGRKINPRYTWASGIWRGYEKIGESVSNSGYKDLTSLNRKNENTRTHNSLE